MGNIKRASSERICYDLNRMYAECTDPRNDGWTAFEYKKDLIKVQWHLQQLINRCPKFAGEAEFVDEYEKSLTWDIIKNDFR